MQNSHRRSTEPDVSLATTLHTEVWRTKIKGSTSMKPLSAHSFRMMSDSLLIGRGFATVLLDGKVFFRLLKPYATATSSIRSHSCRISGRVGGTLTMSLSETVFDCAASTLWPMRSRYLMMSLCGRLRPVQELMYDRWAVNTVGDRSGVIDMLPSGYVFFTCSTLQIATSASGCKLLLCRPT